MTSTSSTNRVELNHIFPVLDTLRFVGALCVLSTHVGFQTGEYLRNGTFGVFLARLDVGVAIFFVLSGFLLSRPHFARNALGLSRPALGRYYVKRVLRIMPVYVVTVVAALLFVDQLVPLDAGQWVSSLLMVDVYHLDHLPQGLAHMWSLATEVAFYVVLPALMLLAVSGRSGASGRRLSATLALMATVDLGWRVLIGTSPEDFTGMAASLPPGFMLWFAAGILLAWVHVRSQQQPATEHGALVSFVCRLGAMPGVCWTLVVALVLVASTPLAGPIALQQPGVGQDLTKHLLYTGIGALLVLAGAFTPGRGTYFTVMSWPALRHLGHISYGLFSIHMVVLLAWSFDLAGVDDFTGHGWRVWAVTLSVSLVLSEVLYRVVELPAINLKRRLPRSSPPASTDRPTTAAATR